MTAFTPAEVAKQLAHGKHQQPETAILRVVAGYLRQRQWFVVRHQQGLGCHKGIADLSATKDSRTVWCEIKTATGKQSEYQVEFQYQVESHGGEYIVARCLEDAIAMDKLK